MTVDHGAYTLLGTMLAYYGITSVSDYSLTYIGGLLQQGSVGFFLSGLSDLQAAYRKTGLSHFYFSSGRGLFTYKKQEPLCSKTVFVCPAFRGAL